MSSPWFSTIVTLSLVLVSLSRGGADELPGSERPLTAGEIAALIRKLESRKFREREEASRALEAAGDDALNASRQASEQSNDPDGLCSSAHRRWTAAGQSNGARVGHLDRRMIVNVHNRGHVGSRVPLSWCCYAVVAHLIAAG